MCLGAWKTPAFHCVRPLQHTLHDGLFEQRKDMPLPQPRRTPAAPQCDKRKASLTGRYPQWPIGPAPSRLNHEIISPGGGKCRRRPVQGSI